VSRNAFPFKGLPTAGAGKLQMSAGVCPTAGRQPATSAEQDSCTQPWRCTQASDFDDTAPSCADGYSV